MKKTWMGRILVLIVAGMMILLGVAVLAVRSVNFDQVKDMLTDQVQAATGRTLTITGPLDFKLGLVPSVVASGISLANPPGASRPEMVKVKQFEMEVALLPLLQKEIRINRLILLEPDILIETEATGPGNLSFTPPAAPREPASAKEGTSSASGYTLMLKQVRIKKGTIGWLNRGAARPQTMAIEELTMGQDSAAPEKLSLEMTAAVSGHSLRLAGQLGAFGPALQGQPWPVRLRVDLKNIELQVEGVIAQLTAFRGLDLRLKASGSEMSEVLTLVENDAAGRLPRLGPFTSSARLQDQGSKLFFSELVVEAGKRELLALDAQGRISDLTGNLLAELRFNAASDNPAELFRLAGADLAPRGPFQLAALFKGTRTAVQLEDMKATLGKSDLQGSLSLLPLARPRISGQLVSRLIDGNELLASEAKQAGTSAQTVAAGKKERLIPDIRLPVDALGTADLDLSLRVDKMVFGDEQLADLLVKVQLKDSHLVVGPYHFSMAGGRVDGELALDGSANVPSLRVRVQGHQVELDHFVKKAAFSGGKSDLRFSLQGSGASLRQVLATADGEAVLSVGPGKIRNTALNLAGGDLFMQILDAFNPLAKAEEYTLMECAVANFKISRGLATTSKGLAMRSSKVDVSGSGTINLDSEALDLGIVPRAREGAGISLSSVITGVTRVRGTLVHPSIGVDPEGSLRAAASLGAGVATGGLSTLGELLLDKAAGDEDPCRTALGQPQSGGKSRQPARRNQGPDPGRLLQELFGR